MIGFQAAEDLDLNTSDLPWLGNAPKPTRTLWRQRSKAFNRRRIRRGPLRLFLSFVLLPMQHVMVVDHNLGGQNQATGLA
jgi:hypothetical protein